MSTRSPELYRTVQIARSILYFVLVALVILWIRGAQNIEPWTVLMATIIAVLEAINLVQQFQPSPAARRSRQLESLIMTLKQSPGSSKYVEAIVSYSGSDGQTLTSVVGECAHFVLTGVSGAGKTTFLHHKALTLAQECLSNPGHDSAAPLPFMVHLSEWTSRKSLTKFLKDQWPFDGDPMQIMATASVWFLADGLDELSGDIPRKMTELRRWLNSENAPYRTVLTCRSVRYNDDLRLPLPEVKIWPELSEAQISEFAYQYLGAEAERFLAAYTYEPPPWAKEAIQGLSLRTPLVLTVLLRAFKNDQTPKVMRNPGAQVDLYLREVWNRELLRNPATQFSFDEMISACARFIASFPMSYGGFTHESADRKETVRWLALGLLEHSHRQRNERSRKRHAIGASLWLPVFFLKSMGRWVFDILIAVPFRFIPLSVQYAQGAKFPFRFGRVFLESLFDYLVDYLSLGPWFLKEIRQYGLTGYVSEFRSQWPVYYFELDTGPAYWRARRCARQLLEMVVDARILREVNRSYEPGFLLIREYFLAQRKRLSGASLDPALLGRMGDPNWQRPNPYDDANLVILAGIAENPDEFIAKLSSHDPYAATLCIASGIDVGSLTRGEVIAKLLEVLTKMVSDGEYRWPLSETYTALQYFPDPTVVEALIDIVETFSFEEVAVDIMEIIVGIGRDAVPCLVRRLPTCTNLGVRVAIISLSRIGDKRAIPPLKQWLQESSIKYYELWARAALSHLGSVDERQLFMDQFLPFPDLWGHPEPFRMRCEPWRAYWQTSPDLSRTLDEFLTLLRAAGSEQQVHGCFENVLTGWVPAVFRLGPQLVDVYRCEASPVVKRVIARVLAERSVVEACDAFMADIYDGDLVWVIIPALGTLKCSRPDVVQALVGYLQDQNPGIRSIALEALGQIRDAAAALAISRLLSDTTIGSYRRRICDIAAEALSEIDSPLARDKASAFYLSELKNCVLNSGKWYEFEMRLERLDRKNSNAIDRIRRDMMAQQVITSQPATTADLQSN